MSQLDMIPPIYELWKALQNPTIKHYFVEGGRGSGKSIGIGDCLLLEGLESAKNILCTREVQRSIEDSVLSQLKERSKKIGLPYGSTEKKMFNSVGTKFKFSGLSGVQIDSVKSTFNIARAWVEEAQSVSSKSIQYLKDTIREKGSKVIYSYNREKLSDPVHQLCASFEINQENKTAVYQDSSISWKQGQTENAFWMTMNYNANPLFPHELEMERLHDYEYHKSRGTIEMYRHTWEGLPVPAGGNIILTTGQVIAASEREPDAEGEEQVGVDVARGGKDKVTMYKRKGHAVIAYKSYKNNSAQEKMRITETAERVERFVNFDKEIPIKVDDTGLGGGVTDILEDMGYNVIGVNFGASAVEKDKYSNAISEMWFNFAQIIDNVSIPDYPELMEELYGRNEDRKDTKGRRRVESKDEFKKRYGRSCDDADGLLLAFYETDNEGFFYGIV